MKIVDEIKISLFNPQAYYKFKRQHLSKILLFQLVVSIIGLVFINIKNFIAISFSKGAIKFADVYKGIGPLNILMTILHMWLGIVIVALMLSSIIQLFYNIKKEKLLSFKDIFNYISHALMIGAILSPFVGIFTIFFIMIIYYMAVKSEKMKLKID